MLLRSLMPGFVLLAFDISPAVAEPEKTASAQKAIDRGLGFLITDAKKWRDDHACSTCHHGTMTVWALCEAKAQGFAVEEKTLTDTISWTKERLKDIDKPRDTRPGWNMVNSPAVYLSVMSLAVPKQNALSSEDLKKITGHLMRHQEDDGSWVWSAAPAVNRPPPFFESDEVVTLLALMSLSPHVPADTKVKSESRASRDKGIAWLAKEKPTETTQALAFRLFQDVQSKKSAKELDAGIDRLLARQNKDGGWGQLIDAPSDAFATGQTIYFLGQAGVQTDRPELRRAVEFLVKTQKEDGSWPMKRRGHPGVTPGDNVVPIIYFGSAWATMGLMRGAEK
jgi:N-acyl-D-amino-acid deacylase